MYVVDEKAVQLAVSHYPTDLARGSRIMHTDTGPGGSYAVLADLGHAPVEFTEFVLARMPRPEESERLDLPQGTPVIEITRQAFEDGGRCVEVNRMILDGSAYLLDYTFPA
jgi:GntR family transcriptional regulator